MKREYKIGLAGIVALVTLFFGINFLKGKALFSNTSEYYVRFANAKELSKSSKVFVDGFEVGIVTDIAYDYKNPGNVIVEINVDPELILCQGTEIKLDAGLMVVALDGVARCIHLVVDLCRCDLHGAATHESGIELYLCTLA